MVGTVASRQEGAGFNSEGPGPLCADFALYVLSGYTSFLPQSKNMGIRTLNCP